MLTVRNLILVVLTLAPGLLVRAQVSVVFPSERAVFQRDNFNRGSVPVTGLAAKEADKIEARLVPMVVNQGTQTEWQVIDSDLLAGTYSGKVTGEAGWYRLEVRALLGANVIALTSVDKIGIGEVFVIAGQSNAQGFLRFNPNGSQDDRVNGYAYYQEKYIEENPTLTSFSHISRELNVGPHGQSAWAWGELGDLIARNENVPVMFFNAAFEGTRIENWVKSIKGEVTYLDGGTFQTLFENGAPYSILRIILQNHISMYGMRSIIWIQGESDFALDSQTYYEGLKFVINRVSQDIGSVPTWMVTRTSRNLGFSFDQIIAAQNRVIDELPNVYAGPNTDNIQPGRIDGTHLSGIGITELAAQIYGFLQANFLMKTPTLTSGSIAELKAECSSASGVTVSLKTPQPKVVWNNVFQNSSFNTQGGVASARVRDAKNNYYISETLNVQNLIPPTPEVVLVGNLQICEGDSVEYRTFNRSFTTRWSDGRTGNVIKVGDNREVFAVYVNEKGCASAQSDKKRVTVLPTPPVPNIISNTGTFGACEGGAVSLSVDASANTFVWSTGEVKHDIFVTKPGESEYRVRAVSSSGCSSAFSETRKVIIHPKPAAPTIEQTGPYSISVSNASNYLTFDWFFEGERIKGISDSRIQAKNEGVYSVQGYKTFEAPYQATCPSVISGLLIYESNGLSGLQVYPNPVSNGLVNLASDAPINSLQIRLINSKGQEVSRRTVLANVGLPVTLQFDNDKLHGTYILVASYEGFEKRFKLVFR